MNLDLRNSHTQPYKCKIEGKPCKGRVSVNENKAAYLCQNEMNGAIAENLLGYKYSWAVQSGGSEQTSFKLHDITDFEFITEEELNAGAPLSLDGGTTPSSLDGKEIEVKIDGVSYAAVLTVKK